MIKSCSAAALYHRYQQELILLQNSQLKALKSVNPPFLHFADYQQFKCYIF